MDLEKEEKGDDIKSEAPFHPNIRHEIEISSRLKTKQRHWMIKSKDH